MRWCVSIGAVFVLGAMAGGVTGFAAPNPNAQFAAQAAPGVADKQAAPTVDVELILAVDVSYSMDMDELALQREGYAQAIVSKEFLQALRAFPTAKLPLPISNGRHRATRRSLFRGA